MGKGSKKLYWAGAGAAFLLVLLLALAVIVPRLVDSAWLKKTIQTEAAKQVNGKLDFQKAEISILPSPSIALQQVSLNIPESVEINLDTIRAYPKLLSLLIGNIDLAEIVIDRPDFSLPLPGKQKKDQKEEKEFSLAAALAAASEKLSPILSAIPGLEVGVHKGTLRLLAGNKEVFLFKNINGSFDVSSKSLSTSISCKSNIWESMELKASFEPDSMKGKGKISLENISNKELADYVLSGKPPLLGGSFSSLQVDFTVNPEAGLTADIKSSGSSFTALHENKKTTATVENLKGNIQYSDQISVITVEDLTLSQPQVKFSGSFNFDNTAPSVSLDINSQDADIASIRDVLPAFVNVLYGDLPVLQDIFAVIRRGTVTRADFHAAGKSPADLTDFGAILIQQHIENGDILLSDLGLDLQGVTGDVTIAQGVLEGKNLQAKLGNSTGSGGTLKLGLVQGKTTPFHLDLDLNADLSEVPTLLKKLVPKKQILEYLSLIENLEGTAQGRLTLGETLESLTAHVEANTISARVNYKPVPYPITIDGGRILYDGLNTHSFDLQGKIGKSSFSHYSSKLNFEGEPTIAVQSGTFHLVLDEIFPWLATDKRLADDLKDIKNLTGLAEITVKSITGPLLLPANLAYDLQCGLQNIILTAALLPGPLTIRAGQANIVPDKITFENLQAILLDSSLTYSGVLQNFINGKTNANVIVTDATIGQELNSWFVEQSDILKQYQFKTPLLISRANAKWARNEQLDLYGDFSIRNGPLFSIDMMLTPDELVLHNLAIQNGNDRAIISLDLEKRKIGAGFKGSLSKKTINEIVVYKDFDHDAWIKGDINFLIDMDSFAESVANGSLEGGDFIMPLNNEKHLVIDSYSFTATAKTINLNSAEAVFENKRYSLNGQASLDEKRLSMDFDIKTDTIELDKIVEAIQGEDEEKEGKEEQRVGKSWDLALDANINIHADSLLYNGYNWKPFESLVTFENSYFSVQVTEAELCHISTPGKISFHEEQITLDFQMEAKEQELKKVLICLEGGDQQMTGVLNLKANISGQGSKDTLVSSLQGKLQYSAKDGYIYQDARLAKLLYVLNVTNIFQGKIPDLTTTGFHYDSLIVRGTMENGVLLITPAKLEAPIMEIACHGTVDIPKKKVDLQVLVAPLQTLNKLQKMLPVISTIIPGNLVAVPIDVSGDFSDIKVRALSMSAIGKNVFGVMVDALSTPVRVLEETPEEKK